MSIVRCWINGKSTDIKQVDPTQTLLYWLRDSAGLSGTKEGCNEGDCGACTVLVSDLYQGRIRHRAMNACLLFLPQMMGKSIRTVEGLAEQEKLHSVQQAIVDHHGSQCGFCTPGFVVSLAAGALNNDTDHDKVLAGNLCRCTGYESIIRAARAAEGAEPPAWVGEDEKNLLAVQSQEDVVDKDYFNSESLSDFAAWYQKNPKATIVAGATDVGLWVTKQFREIVPIGFIAGIVEMQNITEMPNSWHIGAAVTVTDFHGFIGQYFPDFADMLRRYGSLQVRNAGTIGGNVANGSPIGDSPPALIALGALVHLQCGDQVRVIKLEDFFLAYGKQDRLEGEFVRAIEIPKQADCLKCYKISKRFDQDISALCGCFNVLVEDGIVVSARIAFGGMSGVPQRAHKLESALLGKAWNLENIQKSQSMLKEDFTPLSDMRASASYRLHSACNLVLRYYHESTNAQHETRVLEVRS